MPVKLQSYIKEIHLKIIILNIYKKASIWWSSKDGPMWNIFMKVRCERNQWHFPKMSICIALMHVIFTKFWFGGHMDSLYGWMETSRLKDFSYSENQNHPKLGRIDPEGRPGEEDQRIQLKLSHTGKFQSLFSLNYCNNTCIMS